MSNFYKNSQTVKIPDNFSRAKASQYLANRSESGATDPYPETDTVKALYELYVKIGAREELPSDNEGKEGFLSGLWIDIFFKNNLVPADIPADIVISEFSRALVTGVADRKGNNMSAIITAFNKWVVRKEVRQRLYEKRDHYYPGQKPKALPKASSYSKDPEEAEMERLIQGKKIEEWPPAANELLKKMAMQILSIYDDEAAMKALRSFGPKGQMKRTINEAVKRGLIEEVNN